MSNNDMQAQLTIQTQLRESQLKFIYYVLALNVASMGYSLGKSFNQKLDYEHFPLGIAILFWGLSIYCGFSFIKWLQNGLGVNDTYFKFIRGHVKGIRQSDLLEAKVKEATNEVIEDISKKAKKNYSWSVNFFYFGIIFFIIWQVYHMICNVE